MTWNHRGEKLNAGAKWFNPWVFVSLIVSVFSLPTVVLLNRSKLAELRHQVRDVEAEIQAVNQSISDLDSLTKRRDKLASRDSFLERQRYQVLRHCRSADDIPWLSKDFIIAESRHTQVHSVASFIFVPDGEHRLAVEFLESSDKREPIRHGFDFQLLPETGYMLELVYDKAANARSIWLTVTCGRDGFDETSVQIPIADIDVRSSSRRAFHVIAFPAEVRTSDAFNKEPGVEVLRFTWSGEVASSKVEAVARIISKATPCANPQYARRIKLTRRSQEVWYRENGRFELPEFTAESSE